MNSCIYCKRQDGILSKEHIIPYALGGSLVLENASCSECARTTSLIEGQILRGHWLGVRKKLKLPSRHKNKQPDRLDVNIIKANGVKIRAAVLVQDCSFQLLFVLFRPEILATEIVGGKKPYAQSIGFTTLGDAPKKAFIGNLEYRIREEEKVEFLLSEFSAENFMRFLAKIAHGYVIKFLGRNSCGKFFLPEIILGETANAMQYIGSADDENQKIKLNNQEGLHSIEIKEEGKFLTVLLKLFDVPGWQNQPMYQVVVGEI